MLGRSFLMCFLTFEHSNKNIGKTELWESSQFLRTDPSGSGMREGQLFKLSSFRKWRMSDFWVAMVPVIRGKTYQWKDLTSKIWLIRCLRKCKITWNKAKYGNKKWVKLRFWLVWITPLVLGQLPKECVEIELLTRSGLDCIWLYLFCLR